MRVPALRCNVQQLTLPHRSRPMFRTAFSCWRMTTFNVMNPRPRDAAISSCSVSNAKWPRSRNVNLSVRYIPSTDLRSEGSNARGHAFPKITSRRGLLSQHPCLPVWLGTWFDSRRTVRFEGLHARACSATRTLRSTDHARSKFRLFSNIAGPRCLAGTGDL